VETILLAARLFLAAVFLLAGVSKLKDRTGSSKASGDFGLPQALTRPFSFLLSVVEILVSLALVPVDLAWYGACGALALLIVFIIGIGINLARGRRPDCNCFGQLHSAPIGWPTLARNAILAACAGWLVSRGQGRVGPSLWKHLAAAGDDERRIYIVAVCVMLFLLFRALRRTAEEDEDKPESVQTETVDRSPQALDDSAPPRPERPVIPITGLPIGTPAPELELPSMAGPARSLQSLREQGKTIVMVFSSPHCEPCRALWPHLSRWMREHEASLNIMVVSRGLAKETLAKLKEFELSRVLVQREFEISEIYGITSTPAALLIGTDGLIRSEIAVGRDAIQAMITTALNGSSEDETTSPSRQQEPRPL
jgi:uncharacterized membrane protein YphA (DoxX/SURF4 family)/thiol-disulfide isomerase/thioredoxin